MKTLKHYMLESEYSPYKLGQKMFDRQYSIRQRVRAGATVAAEIAVPILGYHLIDLAIDNPIVTETAKAGALIATLTFGLPYIFGAVHSQASRDLGVFGDGPKIDERRLELPATLASEGLERED
jgi:hypothetical protein